MKKKEYDIIYSLGADCGCAFYLKRHNLRSYSGPFDWLTGASFETRLNLILSDFEDFLNKDSIKPLIQDNHPTNLNYSLYQDINLGFYFYHDFSAELSFEDALSEVQKKYQRRIKRFYKKIQNSDRALLIWFSRYSPVSDELSKELCAKVIEKFNNKVDFLLIEKDESKNLGEIEKIELLPNVVKYKLDTVILNGTDNETLGNQIDCDKIFNQYELIIKNDVKLNKLKAFMVKFICIFIPNKTKKKEIRNKLLDLIDN